MRWWRSGCVSGTSEGGGIGVSGVKSEQDRVIVKAGADVLNK